MPRDLPDETEWLLQERQRIGRRIRDARIDRNLTQERVFLAVPLTRSFYQEIESGQGNPTLTTLILIARAIGCPLSDLVGDPPQAQGEHYGGSRRPPFG